MELNASLVWDGPEHEGPSQWFLTLQQMSNMFYAELTVITCFLSVSPSPPDADPKRDGEVTLECSLLTFNNNLVCRRNRLRWVDETGAELLREGVGYEFLKQENCVSVLRVKRQSGNNRTYTCQLVNSENKVEVEADYTPVNTGRITFKSARNMQPTRYKAFPVGLTCLR